MEIISIPDPSGGVRVKCVHACKLLNPSFDLM